MRRLAVLSLALSFSSVLACVDRPKDDPSQQSQAPAQPADTTPAPQPSAPILHKMPLVHHGPMVMKPLVKVPPSPAAPASS